MEILRHELADHGVDAELAYDIIHEHLMLDGNSRLNLATFVSTWMEPQARRLMEECADKNMIDKDEYPQTAEIEERCLKILANLWHAPDPDAALGTSTTGSSEACMLAGLVMRWHWRQKNEDPKAKIRIDLILSWVRIPRSAGKNSVCISMLNVDSYRSNPIDCN
jgi:glutamate decarboxylase